MARLSATSPADVVLWPRERMTYAAYERTFSAAIDACPDREMRLLMDAYLKANTFGRYRLSPAEISEAVEALDELPDLAASLASQLRDELENLGGPEE